MLLLCRAVFPAPLSHAAERGPSTRCLLLCPAVSPASLAERSTCPAALPFGLLMHPAAPSLLALSCSVGIATLLRVNIWLAAALQEEEKAEEEVGALRALSISSVRPERPVPVSSLPGSQVGWYGAPSLYDGYLHPFHAPTLTAPCLCRLTLLIVCTAGPRAGGARAVG